MEKTESKRTHKAREAPPKKDPTPNVLKRTVFDTKNYYYYFTEVWNDR